MASAFDVAAYILERKGEITTLKLQKLVYFAQARLLSLDEKSVFDEKIDAWKATEDFVGWVMPG